MLRSLAKDCPALPLRFFAEAVRLRALFLMLRQITAGDVGALVSGEVCGENSHHIVKKEIVVESRKAHEALTTKWRTQQNLTTITMSSRFLDITPQS